MNFYKEFVSINRKNLIIYKKYKIYEKNQSYFSKKSKHEYLYDLSID